jgi:hypothetical protein
MKVWSLVVVVVVSLAADAQMVFSRGTTGVTWFREGLGAFGSFDGAIVGAPDACRVSGITMVAARGTDNMIRVRYRADGTWSSWQQLAGGMLASDPAAVCQPNGAARVFARGMDNALYTMSTQPNDFWRRLDGQLQGAPDAALGAGGRIDVVARFNDGSVRRRTFIHGEWLEWQSLGVSVTRDPAVARLSDDRLELLVTQDDGSVQHATINDDGTVGTLNEVPGGGIFVGSVDAASDGNRQMIIAGRGTTNEMFSNTFDGTRWLGWQNHGGTLTSDVSVATVAPPARTFPAPPCVRRTNQSTWGISNHREPTPQTDGPPPPTRRWNDMVACVEPGARFPFKGEDLEPGEVIAIAQWRHVFGSQAWGYDIGAWRVVTQADGSLAWSGLREGGMSARNADHLIYGQPVYAMTAGTVVQCWRNAPENDPSGTLHPSRGVPATSPGPTIPGAGNFVVIQEDDGDLVWYMHGQPGSIPPELCPHEPSLYAYPNIENTGALLDLQAYVPPARQARVEAGRFLMRVGNTGASSNPHLHIHKQRGPLANPTPVAFGFAGVRYVRTGAWAPDRPLSAFNWQQVPAGEELPPGPMAILPD